VGDPLLLDEARAQQRVVELERAEAVHGAERQRADGLVAGLQERLHHADTVVRHSTAIIEQHTPTTGERFVWTSGIGTRTTDRIEAGQRLIATLKKLVDEERFTRGQGGRFTLGTLGTVTLAVEVRVERGVRQRRERYATYHPMQSRVKEVELRPTDGTQLSTVLRGITLTPDELDQLKPLPFVRRLERLFGPNLVAVRREARQELERVTADLEGAEQALDSPFPQADELRDARAELTRIRQELSRRMTPEPTHPGRVGRGRRRLRGRRGHRPPGPVRPAPPSRRLIAGPLAQVASWKMRPRVVRRPERTTLTPWRIGPLAHPRVVRTGRSRVAKTTAWPRGIEIVVARDWARGRCSTSTSSPPSWSTPGSVSETTTCSGKTSSP
jgi:hypothetical protein